MNVSQIRPSSRPLYIFSPDEPLEGRWYQTAHGCKRGLIVLPRVRFPVTPVLRLNRYGAPSVLYNLSHSLYRGLTGRFFEVEQRVLEPAHQDYVLAQVSKSFLNGGPVFGARPIKVMAVDKATLLRVGKRAGRHLIRRTTLHQKPSLRNLSTISSWDTISRSVSSFKAFTMLVSTKRPITLKGASSGMSGKPSNGSCSKLSPATVAFLHPGRRTWRRL